MTMPTMRPSSIGTTAIRGIAFLAAQARLENCSLVSVDEVFDAIGVDRQW